MQNPSIRRRPLKLPHVIVKYRLLAAIIPLDGDACPIRFSDAAFVGVIILPTHTVADFKYSRLRACHLDFILIGAANSTRFISPCPVKL
jgi:hypothetical protein